MSEEIVISTQALVEPLKKMRELLPEELELIAGAQGDTVTSSSSTFTSPCSSVTTDEA